jgi:hypothetical protein
LLERIPQPAAEEPGRGILALSVEEPIPLAAYHALDGGTPQAIESAASLEAVLAQDSPSWPDAQVHAAREMFECHVRGLAEEMRRREEQQRRAHRAEQLARARDLFVRAADATYYVGLQAAPDTALRPVGRLRVDTVLRGQPWRGLIARLSGQVPRTSDPADIVARWSQVGEETRRRELSELRQAALGVLAQLASVDRADDASARPAGEIVERWHGW